MYLVSVVGHVEGINSKIVFIIQAKILMVLFRFQEIRDRVLRDVGQDWRPSLQRQQYWAGNCLWSLLPCVHTLNHWCRRQWHHPNTAGSPGSTINNLYWNVEKGNKLLKWYIEVGFNWFVIPDSSYSSFMLTLMINICYHNWTERGSRFPEQFSLDC